MINQNHEWGVYIPEDENLEDEFVCPMCGSLVDASATDCPNCGEPFAPIENGTFSAAPLVTEESELAPVDETLPEEGKPEEYPAEDMDEGELEVTEEFEEEAMEMDDEPPKPEMAPSEGCPICGSGKYSVETGDLVSCDDCGNVYIKKEFVGKPEQNWKLKFWVGLIFIIIGDLGVALGSYVHNVYRWSPLGDLYLGYGWLDQMVGILGVVLFILGLILFAWSFKRDRIVQCPSCKVVVREVDLLPFEEEEEEEVEPEAQDIETAMEEIGEAGECPNCGIQVSLFDEICPNCETPLELNGEVEEIIEEEIVEEIPAEEPEEAILEEPKSASELDETEMIMESLELLEEEAQRVEEEIPEDENGGLQALRELEEEFGVGDEEEQTCPECGMLIEPGTTSCPICGAEVTSGE